VAPERGHWLAVRALDPRLKRDAYGAEIRVSGGGRSWTAWLNPAESYLCSSEPVAHFGLGKVNRIDRIDILWPDGTREAFSGTPADRRIELLKGKGRPADEK
jgi:hypothetical protein